MPRTKGKPTLKFRKSVTTRTEGPLCGAKRRRDGKTCLNPAGFRTNHLGQGRCFKHGGTRQPTKILSEVPPGQLSRYQHVERHALRDLAARLAEAEPDITDLSEELHLLRALLIQYINEYEEFIEALLAWYASPDVKQKPRRIMDISDVSGLIESVSRIAERMHKIRSEGSIDLLTFQRVTEQMGIIVARLVRDPQILARIEAEWGVLALDAKTPKHVIEDEEETDNGEEDEP